MKFFLTGSLPLAHARQLYSHIHDSVCRRFNCAFPIYLVEPDSHIYNCLTSIKSAIPLRWLTIDPVHPPRIAEAILIDDGSKGMHRHYSKVQHINCLVHVYKVLEDILPVGGFCQECFQVGTLNLVEGQKMQYCQNCHAIYIM